MSIEKVIIIIPTYNESATIAETVSQVFNTTLAIQTKEIHVLVFDSNSTDDTQAQVRNLQSAYPKLHLLSEPQKTGLGSAYMQAMRYAMDELSADIVMEFDADLSHQPKYIAPMLANLDKHDVVVGSRYIPGGSIPNDWGWHRKLLSSLGNFVARTVLTRKYKDFTSGFRATRTQALKKALPKVFLSNNYAYKIHLMWSLYKNKAKISEYPIEFIDRTQGKSKLPRNSIVDSLRVLFLLRFAEGKSYFKMCLVGLSGVAIQYLVYNLLRIELSPFNSAQCAVVAAMMNNFTFNNLFTFKDRRLGSRSQLLKPFALFISYSGLMIVFQSYWLEFGIRIFGTGYLKENVIIGTSIVLASFLNYFIFSRFLWRDKKISHLSAA